MPGRMSRNKGARGERALAQALTDAGLKAARGGRAGCRDEDIEHSITGVRIECKYQARPSIHNAIEQAIRDCPTKMPCVCSKMVLPIGSKSHPWLVTVRLDDLMRFSQAVIDARSDDWTII